MPPLTKAQAKQLNLAKAEAVRIQKLAGSERDAKDRADQYANIARGLYKEARNLEKQAGQLFEHAAAEWKKAKTYYKQLHCSEGRPSSAVYVYE